MKSRCEKYIVGIDEVGRGPIAGPLLVVAFCVSKKNQKKVFKRLRGITDSKKLSEKKREEYYRTLKLLKNENLVSYSLSYVLASSIDAWGMSKALEIAVTRCVKKLQLDPRDSFIYLDGSLRAPSSYNQETVVKGDEKIWQISAASVIAKVLRDRRMVRLGKKYPNYGFENHKGYGTKYHHQALAKYGMTPCHRKTWIKV
jgi:ribonuclease HII